MLRFLAPCAPVLAMSLMWTGVCGTAHAQTRKHPAVTIALHASAAAEGVAVTLGDVADVSGAAEGQVRKLRHLPLGRIAGASAPVRLEREQIARWICTRGGLCGPAVAWRGAEAVEVRLATRTVGRDSLVSTARAALEQALAPLGARIVVVEVRGQDKVELPRGRLDYAARSLPSGLVPAKRMQVWVDVLADGRFVRAVPVRFDVSARVPVWVARGPVAAGVRVTREQVGPGEADLAEAGMAVIRRGVGETAFPAGAWIVRQPLRDGQALTRKNSAPAPLVSRGEIATLRMQDMPIQMETRVEVLQDGFLGQAVKVRALQATGAIVATVAGPGLLETNR